MAAYITNCTFNDCTVRNIIMAPFDLCKNPRMRCKQIRESTLRVPPSVFFFSLTCEHQIHTVFHTWHLLPFFLAATVRSIKKIILPVGRFSTISPKKQHRKIVPWSLSTSFLVYSTLKNIDIQY